MSVHFIMLLFNFKAKTNANAGSMRSLVQFFVPVIWDHERELLRPRVQVCGVRLFDKCADGAAPEPHALSQLFSPAHREVASRVRDRNLSSVSWSSRRDSPPAPEGMQTSSRLEVSDSRAVDSNVTFDKRH